MREYVLQPSTRMLSFASARHRYQLDYVEQMVHDATEVMEHAKKQEQELRVLCEVSVFDVKLQAAIID